MSYIDTSVIVVALDPTDLRRKRALEVLESEADKVISEIVLAELASVISRHELLNKQLYNKLSLKDELIVPTLIIYLLKRFNLKLYKTHRDVRLPQLGELHAPIAMALTLSHKIRLRTLDLLHVAYLSLIKASGNNVNKMITMDKELKKIADFLKDDLSIMLQAIE